MLEERQFLVCLNQHAVSSRQPDLPPIRDERIVLVLGYVIGVEGIKFRRLRTALQVSRPFRCWCAALPPLPGAFFLSRNDPRNMRAAITANSQYTPADGRLDTRRLCINWPIPNQCDSSNRCATRSLLPRAHAVFDAKPSTSTAAQDAVITHQIA